MKKIILASESPRRKELLRKAGLKFEVDVSNFNENVDVDLTPIELAKHLSLQKAKTVAEKHKNAIIISADTIVVFNNEIIGKPKDEKDAEKMLKKLSGKPHLVITGFTIIDTDLNRVINDHAETTVHVKTLSKKEIEDYVKTKEPLDKAGGYGIQGLGGKLIDKIEGDFDNVVGLPIQKVLKYLKEFDLK